MDPSNRDDLPPVPFASSKATPSHHLSLNPQTLASASVAPAPVSPALSSSSLLSPSDATPRSASRDNHHNQTAPRRIPSSGSLRDESRKSTPSLQKRSSTASLRSVRNSAGSSTGTLSRRSSSNFATSPTTTNNMMSKKAPVQETIPTAATIAAEHFQKDIDWHQSADLQSKTLVVVHDACYGHRFARPKSSRATLGSIVERPERIRAGVLGVSAAYVRLARRHAGERYAPHPSLDPHALPAPPFQIRKTARSLALNSPAVSHVHGSKWMDDLKTMCDAAESRLALNGKELVRPRSAGKDDHVPEFHQGDLYLCSESLNAFEGALGGVCEGVDAVLGPSSTKRAFVCIRPPGHHCSSGHPSGFCWINNVHIGISYAAMTHGLTHAAILDFDLHHGDGSQEITWAQNSRAATAPKNAALYKKTRIGYFSLHDINSYPCEMGDFEKVRNASVCIDKAHGQSIWNVHLDPWKNESEFWELYATKYAILLEKARAFLRLHTERLVSTPNGPKPKAAIFLSAGFDASEWEGAGMQRHKVNVPTEFYAKFTADVARMAEEEGLGTDGRVISVLEGGYSDRALTSGVLSHLSGLSEVTTSVTEEQQIDRLASEMTDLGLQDIETEINAQKTQASSYDPTWWSSPLLEELEAWVYPAPAVKSNGKIPTYLASTQSFTAKVVPSARDRMSVGGYVTYEPELPPLPEVGWATATHELSKILIPSDRQTMSCRPEDLNAEASRIRRERQAAVEGIPIAPAAPDAPIEPVTREASRMQLRVRKPKQPLPGTPKAESTPKRQAVKGTRRTTIDAASDPTPSLDNSPATRMNRRKSSAAATNNPEDGRSPSRATAPPSRPGTAASNRSTTSRRTSTSRGTTPKCSTSPTQNVPPVPRVPFGLLSTASSEAPPPAGAENTRPDDMDSLMAGVRKLNIKLKVPSPEENAAREKKAAEERKKAAKTSRSQRSSSVLKPSTTKNPAFSASAPPSTAPPLETKQEAREPSPDMASIPSTVTIGRPGSRKASAQSSFAATATTTTSTTPPLTPASASTATTQDTIHPQQQSLFSPATSATQSKHGLPTFTSSDAIPFASASGNPTPFGSRPSTGFSHAVSDESSGDGSYVNVGYDGQADVYARRE
ncbi:histone deacetylase hosB [Aspergillus glaucus CBS 516.65]|uniref:Histone deacetylase domain-containing protein n=1 Tax=Aspergillus glaucus CBS 516.65 TaxID=1160497 RepID=A0A1L9VLN1_ASPGL|nr:hypothetical protein ASPGLDRAFT_46756 [Aspergillus glaucus CBS 516.65]OJJ84839.1 hypothetical protein ASPGLDRAFT_46756 [Aspergillus glaucus CBS 516.65]